MTVVAAFKDGWTALIRNPGLLVAGLLVAGVGQLTNVGDVVNVPGAAQAGTLGFFLLFPFAMAGFVGMAIAALRDGDASLGRVLGAGRRYYTRMLIATVLFFVVVVGILMMTMPIGFVVLVALLFFDVVGQSAAFQTGVALTFGTLALSLLGLLVAFTFLQFYAPAIVLEDLSVVESFRRSAGVVRRHALGVLGFTVLWFLITNTLLAPEYLLGLVLTDAAPVSVLAGDVDPGLGVALPVTVALTAVFFGYFYTVHTAYYLRLVETKGDGNGRRMDAGTPSGTAASG